jgi:hypothetical protein
MEESERSLRSLGVFRQVRVDTVTLADGRLALHAVTADGWSTQPQASFTSVNGEQTWNVGIVERNFLGTATELALIYGRDPDRSRLDFEFVNPHFFGRRTLLNLRYADLSDGNRRWRFGLPFRRRRPLTPSRPTASSRTSACSGFAMAPSGQLSALSAPVGLAGGVSLKGGATTSRRYSRLWGGWEWRREDFTASDTAVVPYSVFTTVRTGIELGVVRLRILEHFNSYARREDVDLSPMLRPGIVMQSGVGYEFKGQASAVWKRGFALLRVDANGLDTTRTRAQLTVVSQDLRRHTLIAHAEGGIVTDPKPGSEFDPWVEQRGPRLFGLHAFTGTRMTWLVLGIGFGRRRALGLFALGAAPFLEHGGAWWHEKPRRQEGMRHLATVQPYAGGPRRSSELALGYRFGDGVSQALGCHATEGVLL